MTEQERQNLKDHFDKQFEDVLIQERSDLYKIFELVDRAYEAERKISDWEATDYKHSRF